MIRCSFFMDEQTFDLIMHVPMKNKKKAKGLINQTFGSTTIEDDIYLSLGSILIITIIIIISL